MGKCGDPGGTEGSAWRSGREMGSFRSGIGRTFKTSWVKTLLKRTEIEIEQYG